MEVGPPSPEAQELSAFIKDVILNSGCVSLTDLCPVKGKYAWILYIDIICLDHDGNLRDASVAALVAAFHSLKLPKLIYDHEMEQITFSQGTFFMCFYPSFEVIGSLSANFLRNDCNGRTEILK